MFKKNKIKTIEGEIDKLIKDKSNITTREEFLKRRGKIRGVLDFIDKFRKEESSFCEEYKIIKHYLKPKDATLIKHYWHNDIQLINIKGFGLVEYNQNNSYELFEGRHMYVPRCSSFRIKNEGKIDLSILEIKIGKDYS